MKNKLFTILIVLALVAAILPAYKVKAEETGHKHCICGAQHTEKGDHVSDTQTEYSTRLYMKDGKLMMGDGEWETRETAHMFHMMRIHWKAEIIILTRTLSLVMNL